MILEDFRIREGSGGAGKWRGGDGVVRRIRFREPMTTSLLANRRRIAPFGLEGGGEGALGKGRVERADGEVIELPATAEVQVNAGDCVRDRNARVAADSGRPTEPLALLSLAGAANHAEQTRADSMRAMRHSWLSALTALVVTPSLAAAAPTTWIVQPQWVAAHEAFLASDALQGRGSATRDEAIAAAYVASQFQGYGLKTAPGMGGYLQTAEIVKPRLNGTATLTVNGAAIPGAALLTAGTEGVQGKLTVATVDKAEDLPTADVVLVGSKATVSALARAARQKHVKLLIVRNGDQAQKMLQANGGAPVMASYLDAMPKPERPDVVAMPDAAFDRLAAQSGAEVALTLPPVIEDKTTTTNAVGYLPGTDPKAGVILLSAHLDHLGVRKDGVIMHGANDDASGTTAVLELAHAMAAGPPPRRGVLFVAYGSEEIGEYGSLYFGAHPPVPLSTIVANLEFEMIGAQDPKLPNGVMMMTGFERSNLGAALKAHGALVTSDPYPEQHFFERSDNYQLALTGVVAHTLSGWAVTPTYHQPTDTLENLNLPFMTRAIQSLIAPVRWLADSDFQPAWAPRRAADEVAASRWRSALFAPISEAWT